MCKHVAAVLYGVGNRLDLFPELFFTLRSLDMGELLTSAGAQAADLAAAADEIGNDDLADIFGIEMESAPVVAAGPKMAKKAAKKAAKKVAKKVAAKAVKKAVKTTVKTTVKKAAKKVVKKKTTRSSSR
jgi:uncharacterized Zn finger protein